MSGDGIGVGRTGDGSGDGRPGDGIGVGRTGDGSGDGRPGDGDGTGVPLGPGVGVGNVSLQERSIAKNEMNP